MYKRGDKEFVLDMFLACQKIMDYINKYPDIEWSIVAKMRDKLIHFYFGVDIPIVWKTTTMDIPALFEKLYRVIRNEGWENEFEH